MIIGGSAGGSAIGVAPQASWIAARVFDDAGNGSESAVHQAFQWALDPDGNPATDDAPQVISASWSIDDGGICNTIFQPDVDALRAADISVVFAAGNYGPLPGTSASPANNAHVQSVGAVDMDGNVALYSARGPSACDGTVFPRLVAPGDNVLTADLSFGGNPYYILVSGTSYSAPHVAGVIALLRGAEPLASVEDVDSALMRSARDMGTAGPDADSGYGLIDAAAALEQLGRQLDMDDDGYAAGSDCNDTNATIHPGAAELRGDGVDQDCNGYDLTIRVHYAVYSHDGKSLRLRASSALREQAVLEIDGVGALSVACAVRRLDLHRNSGGYPRASHRARSRRRDQRSGASSHAATRNDRRITMKEYGQKNPLGTTRDESELLQTIARAKLEWEYTVDALDHLVCLIDGRQRVVRVNRVLERWSLGSVTDAIGKDIHVLLHGDCRDDTCALAQRVQECWQRLQAGEASDFELRDARSSARCT